MGGQRQAALATGGGRGRAGQGRAARPPAPYRSAGLPAPAGRSGSAPATPAASSPGHFGAGRPASSGLVPPSPPPPPPRGRRWPWPTRCPPWPAPHPIGRPPRPAGTRAGRRGPLQPPGCVSPPPAALAVPPARPSACVDRPSRCLPPLPPRRSEDATAAANQPPRAIGRLPHCP